MYISVQNNYTFIFHQNITLFTYLHQLWNCDKSQIIFFNVSNVIVVIHDTCSTWAKSCLWSLITKINIKLNANTIIYILKLYICEHLYLQYNQSFWILKAQLSVCLSNHGDIEHHSWLTKIKSIKNKSIHTAPLLKKCLSLANVWKLRMCHVILLKFKQTAIKC